VLGQNVGIAGVNIRYDLGDDQGLVVRLMCNQTATAKDTNVNFFIDGQLDNSVSDITFSGFSYYGKIEPFFSKIWTHFLGCPVKAAEIDKNFLQF